MRENNFFNLSEKALLQKQHKVNETLKTIRQIGEQSRLYELLLYRIERTPLSNINSDSFQHNDLVISEMSLVASIKKGIFEIQKIHQLFQAKYLSSMGSYKSALNSYIELNNLFMQNKELWNNPPIYYLKVIEGILINLSNSKMYEQMFYFIEHLKSLRGYSIYFQAEIDL